MVIIFFHGIVPGNKIELAWKETWTSSPTNGKESIFWPERWLPNDIGNNVQILSLSYNDVHDDVTEIGKNLLESLVVNARYNNVHHNFKASLFKDSNQILYEIYVYIENWRWHIYIIYCVIFWNISRNFWCFISIYWQFMYDLQKHIYFSWPIYNNVWVALPIWWHIEVLLFYKLMITPFCCIHVGMRPFGLLQLYWLVIALVFLYLKVWWLMHTNTSFKRSQMNMR